MVDPWIEGLFPALQAFLNVSPGSTVPVTCVSADRTGCQPVANGDHSPQREDSDGLQSPAAKAASQRSTVEMPESQQNPGATEEPDNPRRRESDGSQSLRTTEELENPRREESDGSQSSRTGGTSESTSKDEQDGSQTSLTKEGSGSPRTTKSGGSGVTESKGSLQESASPESISVTGSSNSNRTSWSAAENVTDTENSSAQTVSVNRVSRQRSPSPSKVQKLGVRTGEAGVTNGTNSGSQLTGESGVNSLTLNRPCVDGPSLGVSVLPMSERALTLPAATPAFLTLAYLPPDEVGGVHFYC